VLSVLAHFLPCRCDIYILLVTPIGSLVSFLPVDVTSTFNLASFNVQRSCQTQNYAISSLFYIESAHISAPRNCWDCQGPIFPGLFGTGNHEEASDCKGIHKAVVCTCAHC